MTFRPATSEDSDFFWYWREWAENRHWYEGNRTTREQHEVWFQGRTEALTMLVWEHNGEPAGVVRIDSNGEVAFHAPPTLAPQMLEELKPYAEQYGGRLKVTIDPQDKAAAATLKEAGFQEHPVKFFAYRAMTTVAIMQPTYLPWCGYFDLIDQADVFVLLDTVQVSKQSWQTRNRIRGRDGNVVWLSVPAHITFGQRLDEVTIANERDWQSKHLRTLRAAYGHAPHWDYAAACFIDVNRAEHCDTLANLTTKLIRETAIMLGITTRIVRASQLARQRHGRVERLADILQSVGATEFLQTAGGRDNLNDATDIEGIPIRWHEYQHPVYSQGDSPWMSRLSVIDLLAWHGPDALDVIRSGRHILETVEQ